jgi:hypothetical protein
MQAEQWRIVRVISQSDAIFGEFINKDYAFFSDGVKVYAGAGVYDKSFFFENICNYEKYPYEYWTHLSNENKNVKVLACSIVSNAYTNEKKKVIPIITFQRILGSDVVYTSNISSEKIENMLKSSAVIGSTEFLILDKDKNVLLDTNKNGLYDNEIEQLKTGLLAGQSQSTFVRGKDKYLTFSITSDNSGLLYVSIVPMHAFNQVMNMNLYLIIGIGAVMILLGISLALLFSLRIYGPINSVINILLSNTKCESTDKATDKTIDEIQFLKQGVELLLNNEQQYQRQFVHYDMEYAQHCLKLIVSGISSSNDAHLDQTLKSVYHFKYGSYICCNILFDYTFEFYQKIEALDRKGVMNNFRNILRL